MSQRSWSTAQKVPSSFCQHPWEHTEHHQRCTSQTQGSVNCMHHPHAFRSREAGGRDQIAEDLQRYIACILAARLPRAKQLSEMTSCVYYSRALSACFAKASWQRGSASIRCPLSACQPPMAPRHCPASHLRLGVSPRNYRPRPGSCSQYLN